nr:MAG TPA: hypothetical protein [Caudoviricetes sp.]
MSWRNYSNIQEAVKAMMYVLNKQGGYQFLHNPKGIVVSLVKAL